MLIFTLNLLFVEEGIKIKSILYTIENKRRLYKFSLILFLLLNRKCLSAVLFIYSLPQLFVYSSNTVSKREYGWRGR